MISGTVLLAGISGDNDEPTLLRVNADGTIPNTGGTLAGLDDVEITSPVDGHYLAYDAATSKWVDSAGLPGSGTVTSVGLSAPAILTVSSSPVTTNGTITLTLATQAANKVFAGPSTGADATPTFRSIVAADIPALPYISSTTVQVQNNFLAGPASGANAAPTFRLITSNDVPNVLNATAFGGSLVTGVTLQVPVAPTGNANYGAVSLGSGPFDGATAGFFVGSTSGTNLAINTASGFAGNPIHVQKAGVDLFKLDASGVVTIGTPEATTTTSPQLAIFTAGAAKVVVRNTTGDVELAVQAGSSAGFIGTVNDARLNFIQSNTSVWAIENSTSRALMPLVNNTYDLGTTALRARTAYIGTSIIFGSATDAVLLAEAADILAQRRTTNAQEQRWYGTWTDASNYERFVVRMVAAGTTVVGNEKAGTGTARALAFMTNGTTALTIATTGTATFTSSITLAGSMSLGSGTQIKLLNNTTLITSQVARTLVLGDVPQASPQTYTLAVGESSRGGTDTDVAGGNATIQSGAGTGAGAVTSIIFNTPTVGSTGSVQQVYAARLTLSSAGAVFTGVITNSSGIATPAGGSTAARLLFGTTAGFGVYYGSGAPTVSAAKGSIYLRSDGTGTLDRCYVNTDGSTTWTAFTTVA